MKELIRQKAIDLGFTSCGFTTALPLDEEMPWFSSWLESGFSASMGWIHQNLELRQNPTLLHRGTKSIIVVTLNYYPHFVQSPEKPQIAKYSYGKDYHKVIKKMLKELLNYINTLSPCDGRPFVDSAPVLERPLAVRAGLGWRGKNSLLLTKKGSYFVIGELFTSLEIAPDAPFDASYCGNCTACLEACPTQAIVKEGVIDSNRCLSYLTIEHKGDFQEGQSTYNHAFGCDICQDVCPWNKDPQAHTTPPFTPQPQLISLQYNDFKDLTEHQFDELFNGTPVKRATYHGFIRNISHL